MVSSNSKKILSSPVRQFIVSFAIPTVILLFLSSESRLGPLWAMALALVFPVALELYSLRIRRKPSALSLLAIVSILLIGVISLLGLSEEWLAVRRSAFYVFAALALIIILHFRRKLVDKGLERILDMNSVRAAAKAKGNNAKLDRHTTKVGYMLAVCLLAIGVASYIMTIVFISSPTGSSQFNEEYARLRVLSIPFITVPFLVVMTGLLLYLASGFEKFTGIDMETFLKKKPKQASDD